MCTFSEATANIASSLRNNAPVIGVIFGVGTLIGSGVMACVATKKSEDILEDHKELLAEIKAAKEKGAIDEKTASKEIGRCYGRTAWKLFRKFAPAIGMAVIGSALVFSGYHSEHMRYLDTKDKLATTSAALAATFADFSAYRERTRERFGPEVDNELMYDIRKEEVEETVVDGKGKEKTKKHEENTIGNVGTPGCGVYAKWFNSESSSAWMNDSEMNLNYLLGCQQRANTELKVQGTLTINDIYDIVGLQDEFGQPLKTKAGQVMGYINDPAKINQIDFGIYEPVNADFINGKSKDCLICPMPEGNVWEMLDD